MTGGTLLPDSETSVLVTTAQALVAHDKGILAMDESTTTCNARFAALGIPQSVEARRAYRELLASAPGLGESISGAILYDETIHQCALDGTPLVRMLSEAGIVPGIKVDMGTSAMAGHEGERLTDGLDGLRERLAGYVELGARFAKWRAVFAIGEATPSRGCLEANAVSLARYAALCQEAGLVPVVEPEVLMAGAHTLQRCLEVSSEVLRVVFGALNVQGVHLEAMLLKPNMVLPGSTCPVQDRVSDVVDATASCLLRTVPAAVPGIVFLSGGQTPELASLRLNELNLHFSGGAPWSLSFSYGRALQQPALELWCGEATRAKAAQDLLVHRAHCNRAARSGEYSASMERR